MMFKYDEKGRKYEYRDELEKYLGQNVEITLKNIKVVRPGSRLQILGQFVELEGKVITTHAWCNLTNSIIKKIGKKSIKVEKGDTIVADATVIEYTNKKGQKNYSFKLTNIK